MGSSGAIRHAAAKRALPMAKARAETAELAPDRLAPLVLQAGAPLGSAEGRAGGAFDRRGVHLGRHEARRGRLSASRRDRGPKDAGT